MQTDCAIAAGDKVNSHYSSWFRLVRDRRWSSSQKRDLIRHFNCPTLVLSASEEQTRRIIRGQERHSPSLIIEASIEASVEVDMAWLDAEGHHLISMSDQRYPPLLRELVDPPLVLFAIGNVELLKDPQVAIVGSRKPTPIGDRVTCCISSGLAKVGVIVTSGMALGIDGIAHQAAFETGAATIAVLGNGLDTVYPSRHRALFERLSCEGLLLSEYPLGVKPDRYTFPQRNRIVSGLSLGVVIVEAAERSGTLITARLALEQNKELMVVPGSALSRQYAGSHRLLQQGAALVSSAEDVVHCLSEPLSRFLQSLPTKITNATALEQQRQHILLKHISTESTSIDHIISSSQLTAAKVSSMLLELELIGAVAIANDGGYVNLC